MFNQMRQMKEMQKKASELQKQLEAIKVAKSNSSKTLTVTVNGAQRIDSIRIEPTWFVPEKKAALEASLVQMINEAFGEIQKQTASQAAALMKDLKNFNIPGL
jgi:DNA-binding YbaB/EbfC family protein